MKKTMLTMLAMMVVASGSASAQTTQEVSGKDVTTMATNQAIQGGLSSLKANSDQEWLKRTDISVNMSNDFKPTYEVHTLQPIHKTDKEATFYQLRIARNSDVGTTTNLGLGYRTTSDDKNKLYGVNVFYDEAWKYKHERVGLGLEYFVGKIETRANVYHGISGERLVDPTNSIFEKVVDGMDFEIGGEISPYAKLYVGGYQWDYKHTDDLRGYKVRSEVQLTNRVNVEVGYYHDSRHSDPYAKLMYTLGDKNKPSLFGKTQAKAVTKIDNSTKLLDKVQRENDIRVETYSKTPDGNGGLLIVTVDGKN